jgi:hypothetical protein
MTAFDREIFHQLIDALQQFAGPVLSPLQADDFGASFDRLGGSHIVFLQGTTRCWFLRHSRGLYDVLC